MNATKSLLRGWIFWLIISVILLALLFYLMDDWKLDDERLGIMFLVFSITFTVFLFNASCGKGVKLPLTLLICAFAVYLLCAVADGLYIDSYLTEDLLMPLSLSLLIPSWAATLLRLVWKN